MLKRASDWINAAAIESVNPLFFENKDRSIIGSLLYLLSQIRKKIRKHGTSENEITVILLVQE